LTSESALIVPVPEAERVVKELRARYDPAAPAGVPAHVTVLYPFIVPEALSGSILAEVEMIFTGVAPFPFNLSGIARFRQVVYLAPDPADGFSRLTAAIATRWPEAPPYGGIHNEVVPHLTIANTSDARAAEEIQRIIEPALPVACTARQAWLMVGREGGWSLQRRFRFGGTPP
jgi:2'-5' RNA ligase